MEAEHRIPSSRAWGVREMESRQSVQDFSCAGWKASGDLMHGIVIIVNNTVFYTRNLLS